MEKCQTNTCNFFTMEAEYVACYEATCHVIWLWNFISALEVVHPIFRPLKLLCNNCVVVSFSRSTSRSKHIDVKFFFCERESYRVPHFS